MHEKFGDSLPPPTWLHWQLHGVTVAGSSADLVLRRRWQRAFAAAARPSRATPAGTPELRVQLETLDTLPPAPADPPDFRQGELLAYYLHGRQVLAHLPRYGQLALDLAAGRTHGWLLPAALDSYGVLEDLLALSLAPHLRRRGLFLIHAFAAVYSGRALLLVGDRGAGKTTTGMALIDAGWQLLSNDSPLINGDGEVLRYPGMLAAYPDTLARFPVTSELAQGQPEEKKVLFAATEVWPEVWAEQAPIGAICFPHIDLAGHAVEPLSSPETLRRMLPHAVEQWDRSQIAPHLAALRALVERAPGYLLRLGPDLSALPPLLAQLLTTPL